MKQSYKGPSKFFPRLNIDVLKVHTARWVAQYPDVPIDRIVLYNYASKFQKHYDKPIKYKKYAVVFEISVEDKVYGLSPKEHFEYDMGVVNCNITPDPYYYFVKDLEWDTSVFPKKTFKALITEDFTNVYWEKPVDTFRNEWIFIPRPIVFNPEEKKQMPIGLPANIRVDEPHIILFQTEEISQKEIPFVDVQDDTIGQDLEPYIFRRTRPTWEIIYQGKPLKGLRGKGFGYIHFLVKNKPKKYHTDELTVEVDKISDPDILDKLKQDSTEKTDNNDYDNKKKKGTDHRDMVDGKSKIEIKEHWKYLKQELDKAIDDNDPMRIDKTRKELETFKDDYFKLFRPGGKSRQFIDDTKKNQDRISKNIKRALEKIKKYDKLTWQHFKSALDSIHTYYLSYTPDRHINWLTD